MFGVGETLPGSAAASDPRCGATARCCRLAAVANHLIDARGVALEAFLAEQLVSPEVNSAGEVFEREP
jgi:hypothetical protein